MRISNSVRILYDAQAEIARPLKELVDERLTARRAPRWHYESRIKGPESFALKLETGRFSNLKNQEDIFGATIVVPNAAAIDEAEKMVKEEFDLVERRPKKASETPNVPSSFFFDDLRLYVRWRNTKDTRPKDSVFSAFVFEIQIKTFLQHAWGIATHDLIYKGNSIDWSMSRIAYQVKAMLEHAEITIAQAEFLAKQGIQKSDSQTVKMQEWLKFVKTLPKEILPKDLVRLATNISEMSNLLGLKIEDVKKSLNKETAAGRGTNLRSLSPFSIILDSLVRDRGMSILEGYSKKKGKLRYIFVPDEMEIETIPEHLKNYVLRPGVSTLGNDGDKEIS